MRTDVVLARADVVATKLGIILSFFFLYFHTPFTPQILIPGWTAGGVRALWVSENPLWRIRYLYHTHLTLKVSLNPIGKNANYADCKQLLLSYPYIFATFQLKCKKISCCTQLLKLWIFRHILMKKAEFFIFFLTKKKLILWTMKYNREDFLECF